MAQVKITQTKSVIDRPEKQKRIVKALGLHKIGHSVVQESNPQIEGMIRKVNHLITIEKI